MTATVINTSSRCALEEQIMKGGGGGGASVRCVCCNFVGGWDLVQEHVVARHAEMSLLRGSVYKIGGAQQLDMSAILFTTGRQLYSCFVQELTGAGRPVCVYKDHATAGQHARALLRHTSELDCAHNRTYPLEWNTWFIIPMKDLDRFADSRNYEICLMVD